jgi:hypothetical protein
VAADFDLHQVLGQQQVEAVFAQHQFAQQLMGHAVRVLGQRRQGFALARARAMRGSSRLAPGAI